MKRKYLVMALAVTMVIGMTACGKSRDEESTLVQQDGGSKVSGPKVSGETEEVELHGIKYKKAKDMTTENITLTYFHFDQEETVQYLEKRFEEIYPNINVKTVYESAADYLDTLNTYARDKNLPDVIMFSDADYELSNATLADIKNLWDSDPETKEIASTINDAGIGTFQSGRRYAVPVKFFPGIIYIDRNVLKKLNIPIPERDWTWSDMIDLIRKATVNEKDSPDGKAYYGCGCYNRLDSYYGIASSQKAIGEFGYDGERFDLTARSKGKQEFAELKQGGYIAPDTYTLGMENWMGDIEAWCGDSEHVALFAEAFWRFQGKWNTDKYKKNYDIDIIPYAIPMVNKEEAKAVHHSIATIDFGGLTSACEYPREAYELLKFMSFGQDGWKTRIELYNDETQTNGEGALLKQDEMPAPITTNQEVWEAYIDMYCKGMKGEDINCWRDYFKSCLQPIPFGWTSIAGYWNFGNEEYASIDEAESKADYFHAKAMLDYFGPDSKYNVLTSEDVQKYNKIVKENSENE